MLLVTRQLCYKLNRGYQYGIPWGFHHQCKILDGSVGKELVLCMLIHYLFKCFKIMLLLAPPWRQSKFIKIFISTEQLKDMKI